MTSIVLNIKYAIIPIYYSILFYSIWPHYNYRWMVYNIQRPSNDLQSKLSVWTEINGCCSGEHAGFQEGFTTFDHILTLCTITALSIIQKYCVYSAFFFFFFYIYLNLMKLTTTSILIKYQICNHPYLL